MSPHRRKLSLAVLTVVGLGLVGYAGCAGDGSGMVDDMIGTPDPPIASVTLAELQADIFDTFCAVCHFPGGSGPMPLDNETASYQSLVGVLSIEIGGLLRVEAGNSEDSYLVHKVEGRPSIVGQRMPPQPPLTTEQIAAIREWIDAGAEP